MSRPIKDNISNVSKLVEHCRNKCGLVDSQAGSIAQKLYIFLSIMGHEGKIRGTQDVFQNSGWMIHNLSDLHIC